RPPVCPDQPAGRKTGLRPRFAATAAAMSEYQYYEFQAIHRPVSEADRQALRDLSTRARITATSFTNTYEWGDFKGDPAKLMEQWFDLVAGRGDRGRSAAFLFSLVDGGRRRDVRGGRPRAVARIGADDRLARGFRRVLRHRFRSCRGRGRAGRHGE